MIVTRFAPSPTGELHLGHAAAALFAYRAAMDGGGTFLLRLEDIDPVRCRPEYAEDIFDFLRWLGLSWPEPVRRQSEHMDDYAAALDKLRAMGLVYPCFCTRKEVMIEAAASIHAPHDEISEAIYPGTCRKLSPLQRAEMEAERNRAPVWRLDMAKALAMTGPLTWTDRGAGQITARPEHFGDVVLARRDVPTSYHLSVVVDDALQGVTLVTRGNDLMAATDVHRVLQTLLGLPEPLYHHHPLLLDASGKRLAKRDKAVTLRSLRDEKTTAQEITQTLSDRMGWK